MAIQHSLKRSRSPSPSPVSKRCRVDEVPQSTQPIRFLIISDPHDFELPSSYPASDVVLHCGDLTEDGSPSSIEKALKSFGNLNAELKLLIAGNLEISLDKAFYLSEGGNKADVLKAQEVLRGPVAQETGVTFLEEGTHTFTLKSGASFTIYASPFTPAYGSSAFQYPSSEDRFNYAPETPKWATNVGTEKSIVPNNVDIVMTHAPPKYLLDATSDGGSAGCEHLRRAIARAKPRLHCFGHIHGGYGAQRIECDKKWKAATAKGGEDCIVTLPKEFVGRNQAKRKGYASLSPGSAEAFRDRGRQQTLVVNAAIEDERGEPENAPWLVELDLPVTKEHPSTVSIG